MESKKRKNNILLLFLQGALIGTGAILPGVSGGVLCVAFGIYEPMMEFLAHPIQSLRRKYQMFLPLLLGAFVGFVLLAKVMESFLAVSATAAMALFSGLICGTVPDLFRQSNTKEPEKGWSCFILALVLSFVFFHVLDSGFQGTIQPNFGWYILCGVVWGLSMLIPGLSSSSILLFIGLYQPMAEGIGNLDWTVILPLLLGFVLTVLLLSKVVNKLLHQYATIMFRLILGFVISSILMITPISFSSIPQLCIGIACFAGGFFISWLMDYYKARQN